jgi:hypothetical protein
MKGPVTKKTFFAPSAAHSLPARFDDPAPKWTLVRILKVKSFIVPPSHAVANAPCAHFSNTGKHSAGEMKANFPGLFHQKKPGA